jgi:hypothetical protein
MCEEPTELSIVGTDACSGSNVNIEYLLFLDLDGDDITETVVNSVQVGIAGLGWNNVRFQQREHTQFCRRDAIAHLMNGQCLRTKKSVLL